MYDMDGSAFLEIELVKFGVDGYRLVGVHDRISGLFSFTHFENI